MREKRVLVTGAAGFIGSNLVDSLLDQGAVVYGLDNFWNGQIKNLKNAQLQPNFHLIKSDVRDFDRLINITKDIDVIFHEAALTSVPESVKMPELCNDVNVGGTLNILNAARINDVEKVVFASSAALYGNDPTLPKVENMRLDPESPYGVSKMAGEAYMTAYHRVYGMNTTSLRYFNVFGPRQRDSPYSGVIAIFIGRIFEGKNPVIFGDGMQTRDYIYVKDIINANILAAQSKAAAGAALNVGTGSTMDLKTLTEKMIEFSGMEGLKIEYGPEREGDIKYSSADVSKVKELTGFSAQYDVISGFKQYLDYYKQTFYPERK